MPPSGLLGVTSYFDTTCPGCSRHLRVREAYAGLSIVCNHCDHAFVVSPPEGIDPIAAESPEDGRPRGLETEAEAAKERIAALEEEAGRLRSELSARSREAADEADRAVQAREQLVEALASMRMREDELQGARRGRESDARLLREVGSCLADRDRLRSEFREASARLGAVVADSARAVERAVTAEADRDRLDSACRGLERDLERSGVDRDQLRSEVTEVESRLELARGERDDTRRRWQADRSAQETERTQWQSEGGRLRADLEQAAIELGEMRALLESERAERGREAEAFQSEAQRLRRERDALRLEGEATRKEAAGLIRDRDRLQESLRRSVAESDEARDRHAVETRELSEALTDAQGGHREALDRLGEVADQLRATREEMAGVARDRQVELREHRLALDTLRSERDSERRVHLDRIEEERSSRREETSQRLAELNASRSEADRMRGDLIALSDLVEGHRREVERIRSEADALVAERAGLLDRHEEACRDREEWRSRCLAAESLALSASDGDGIFADERIDAEAHSAPGPERCSCMARDLDREPATAVSLGVPDASRYPSEHARTGENEPRTGWSLPEAADLASAREQVALLSDLLRTAQQANVRLSDRLSALRSGEASLRMVEAVRRSDPPQVESVVQKERDEAAWHLDLARRAARLAQKRKSGRT